MSRFHIYRPHTGVIFSNHEQMSCKLHKNRQLRAQTVQLLAKDSTQELTLETLRNCAFFRAAANPPLLTPCWGVGGSGGGVGTFLAIGVDGGGGGGGGGTGGVGIEGVTCPSPDPAPRLEDIVFRKGGRPGGAGGVGGAIAALVREESLPIDSYQLPPLPPPPAPPALRFMGSATPYPKSQSSKVHAL